ncbi:probable LRR receptor-like serine/threonine-protein kinase At3g47570 [Dioscorea cayenensis subsp. rotundata]|uniref:Receptor kinase-like protein Xa21 n=1 Tax=Dioscorea cayennensis subsp. rotundata TaxID=55577 RepID=A0AB40D1H5_DIOCR|nr:probable LRR receptor-like serine/threonine-protein kinase At3g47570 [Dioscorea cayenensis subsp. rotundata]
MGQYTVTAASSNDTERSALLAFRDQITSDPSGVLKAWNNSIHFCKWYGVTCSRKHPGRVIALDLASRGMAGAISPAVANLTFLRKLLLMENGFNGDIPQNIGHLHRLQQLNMSFNSLYGSIPASLANCSELRFIDLSANKLTGMIPVELGYLSKLDQLVLDNNSFVSVLPSSLGNLSSLTILSINCGVGSSSTSYCLHGNIPEELGNLAKLKLIDVSGNMLSGTIPPSFFTGPIPVSLSNASRLAIVDLSQNNFTGQIPPDIGRGGNIWYINLEINQLEANDVSDWRFMGSLTNCSSLKILALDDNNMGGALPSSIANLSNEIQKIYMGDGNDLEGPIPSSLGSIQRLNELQLSMNRLNGSVPVEILSLSYLSNFIMLSDNFLTGSLPIEVGRLRNIRTLLLSHNKLYGEIPTTISGCVSLEVLELDDNMIQGTIPPSLSNIRGLQILNLSNNSLSGSIPQSFGSMKGLQELLLSHNNLSGVRYPRRASFQMLLPSQSLGIPGLCGGLSQIHLTACPLKTSEKRTRWRLLLTVGTPIACFILFSSLAFLIYKRQSRKRASSEISMNSHFPRITYGDLLRATGGFSDDNLVGRGRHGSVYKGILETLNTTTVAVKVFNLAEQGASRSFSSECKVLRTVRHRNIIKAFISCSSIDSRGHDFKALVYEFMSNGSLETWLHPETEEEQHKSQSLTFIHRLSIAIDIADALEYLHEGCQPPMVHCDIKPGNILLDNEMIAHVADFGLAKVLSGSSRASSRSSIAIRGSIGYVPPEYGVGGQATTSGDVYSYGILLLEMLTGKRPADDMFKNGLTLRKLVEMQISSEGFLNIVDPLMLPQNHASKEEECFVSVALVGLSCSIDSPYERPIIAEVATKMHAIKTGIKN